MLHFKVAKMTCGHCVRTVTDAVHGVDAAAQVSVDLTTGEVSVSNAAAGATDRIVQAIGAAGYDATLLDAAA